MGRFESPHAVAEAKYLGKCSMCGRKIYEGDDYNFDWLLEVYWCDECVESNPDVPVQ